MTFRFHRLIRRSSAEMKCSPSLLGSIELMWYVWPFANVLRRLEAIFVPVTDILGSTNSLLSLPPLIELFPAHANVFTFFSRTFHSFTVLSKDRNVMHYSSECMALSIRLTRMYCQMNNSHGRMSEKTFKTFTCPSNYMIEDI